MINTAQRNREKRALPAVSEPADLYASTVAAVFMTIAIT